MDPPPGPVLRFPRAWWRNPGPPPLPSAPTSAADVRTSAADRSAGPTRSTSRNSASTAAATSSVPPAVASSPTVPRIRRNPPRQSSNTSRRRPSDAAGAEEVGEPAVSTIQQQRSPPGASSRRKPRASEKIIQTTTNGREASEEELIAGTEPMSNFDKKLKKIAAKCDKIKSDQVKEAMKVLAESHADETQETPERLSAILKELKKSKVIDRCQMFEAQSATVEDLHLVHTPEHVEKVMSLSSTLKKNVKASMYSKDMYFSTGTTDAILLAAGGAIQACDLVMDGPYLHSFAIVRPPGHHVGSNGPPFGFCFVNNTSLAAKHALTNHHKEKILILDWDIHHGDGTQKIFYDDKRVLFFSVHRYEKQEFFPFSLESSLENTGDGTGEGYNMNVCWEHDGIRDPDYLAVWDYLLLPLIKEFEPELILISAGFDAAKGDLLGGCEVTSSCFAYLLQKLTSYPIVMVLEGGYYLPALAKSVVACIKVLLGDECSKFNYKSQPFESTWKMIKSTRQTFRRFWRCFEEAIPSNVTCNSESDK